MRNTLVVSAILSCLSFLVWRAEAQQPAATPSPTTSPAPTASKHGVAWLDTKGDLQITFVKGKATVALPLEKLGFDPVKKIAAPFGGISLKLKETPVEFMITNPGGAQSSSIGNYSNLTIDVTDLHGKYPELSLIEQVTTDDQYLCTVVLPVAQHKTIAISDDYQVFADEKTDLEVGGPFVKLRFDGAPRGSKIEVTRNGKAVGSLEGEAIQTGVVFDKVKKSEDVVEWQMSDDHGTSIKKGTFGFPIAGRQNGLVDYVVRVARLNAK